jgi:hypothetical protein
MFYQFILSANWLLTQTYFLVSRAFFLLKYRLYRSLFDLFHGFLENQGIKVSTGVMVDVSFVQVPRRRVISESELKNQDKHIIHSNKPSSYL